MKQLLVAASAAVMAFSVSAEMMTVWGEKVTRENCHRDYPRPQMVRSNWVSLNGDWDYAITSVTNTPGRPTEWAGKIRVPFAIESVLSGVGKLLEPDQFLWYTRKLQIEKKDGERILLHFGAVDFRTMVFIGHKEVTDVPHEGGQNPFTLDITDYVVNGENELTVCVWDPTENFVNSRGKQCFEPHGCFYTRVSGIWQTVWMERVPEKYIKGYEVVTDIDAGTVTLKVKVEGQGQQRKFSLLASKGLLPRALAIDLGATLMALRREKIGKFDVAEAVPFAKLLEAEMKDFAGFVMPLSRALA